MTIKNQFLKIIKAAPHLPRQTFYLIVALISVCVFIYKGINENFKDWEMTQAQYASCTKIQERIKDKKPDYFFGLQYSFQVKGDLFYHFDQESYSTLERADRRVSQLNESNHARQIWYLKSNPNKSTSENPENDWIAYFMVATIMVCVVLYIKWILLKYYKLELDKK